VLPLWRSISSLNLMLPKEERKAMLLRLYNDNSPLIDHNKERNMMPGGIRPDLLDAPIDEKKAQDTKSEDVDSEDAKSEHVNGQKAEQIDSNGALELPDVEMNES
jgi:multisite-specific tRNA:(cytosine-C5)-methyltransferase